MALVERKLRIAIQAVPNQTNQPQKFSESGTSAITLDGHRASLRVSSYGGVAGSEADLAIWGLSQSIQDQLSTLGQVLQLVPRNTMTITAGDDKNGFSTVFIGVIVEAHPDFSGIPDVPMRIRLNTQAAGLAVPFPASSYKGGTDVATVISAIAGRAGYGFENNGVSVTISSPYLSGTAISQIRKIAKSANINAVLINNVMCIWPLYGTRKGLSVPLVAPPPDGQMIGWPDYTQQGIKVSTIFDPRIVMGGQLQVKSSLKLELGKTDPMRNAIGTWNIGQVSLALDQLIPKGQWMTTAFCYNPQHPTPIPPKA